MKTHPFYCLIALFLSAMPQTVSACSVCMGAQDSPSASAVNNAIFIMFGVLGLIFAGIGSVFFSFYRRAKNAAAEYAGLSMEIAEVAHHA